MGAALLTNSGCWNHEAMDAFQFQNAEAPIFQTEQFTRVSDIASRTLRSSYLSLRPPRLKSRLGQDCLAYRASSVWNSFFDFWVILEKRKTHSYGKT